jgi:hypothetical protein
MALNQEQRGKFKKNVIKKIEMFFFSFLVSFNFSFSKKAFKYINETKRLETERKLVPAHFIGAMTFSITTFSITTFSKTTFSKMTLSITTFSIMDLIVTLSINDCLSAF